MSDLIAAAQRFAKRTLLTGLEPAHGRYRYAHTLRVAELGRRIARAEGLDEEAVAVACLLHDIGYVDCRTKEDYEDHGLLSAELAAGFLQRQGCSRELRDTVCYGIRIHTLDEAALPRPATAAELTVADADNIDRFDAYRLYEGLHALDLGGMSCAEVQNYARTRLSVLRGRLAEWPFATPTAARLWAENLARQTAFFDALCSQMDTTLEWDPDPETL